MRKIDKGHEPEELTRWKRCHPKDKDYESLGFAERQAINRVCINEQFGLCAYCCKKVTENNSVNEHIEARALAPNRGLDFSNIVASCTTRGQCDYAHKNQVLPLTPLMSVCETELKFNMSGKVDGLTDRAQTSIEVLKLNNRDIQEQRKQLLDASLFPDRFDDLKLLEDELLLIRIDELNTPNSEGKLLAFSPALVNIIKQFLKA